MEQSTQSSPTSNVNQLNEDDFWEQYKPQLNHLDQHASFDGCLYETVGKELQHVFTTAQQSKTIWTVIETESGGLVYAAGLRLINRIGFFITKKPWNTGDEIIFLNTPIEEDK